MDQLREWFFGLAITDYASYALEGIVGAVAAGVLSILIVSFRFQILAVIKNLFGAVSTYEGRYHAYRWGGTEPHELVKATVWIEKPRFFNLPVFFLPTKFYWKAPKGDRHGYPIVPIDGHEIYATGPGSTPHTYSHFAIQHKVDVNASILSGIYAFTDQRYRIAAGAFLLSKDDLDEDFVENVMPANVIYSLPETPSDRELELERFTAEKVGRQLSSAVD